MKNALTPAGKVIEAGPKAPLTAICPCCGSTLLLRSRRRMRSSKRTYFWRHKRNEHLDCSGRRQSSA